MATKSQLKQYFETGKIPTQAQFAELINSFINIPSQNTKDRGNQNLFFGNGEENPYIQGIRTISKANNSSNSVVNMWIFSTYNNNDGKLAIPMFILMRTNTKNPGLLPGNNTLRYCIPDILNIETFVQQGVDCNTSTDDDIFNTVYNWQFKPFGEGGSTFPRVAYIDGQSAWDTWLTKFKAAHPEAANGGGSGSPLLNQWVIDSYTFIIECSGDIKFATGSDTYEFLNCTIINNDITEEAIVMDFTNCVFRNCHINSGYLVQDTEFYNCTCNFDARAQGCTFNNSSIYGIGLLVNCTCAKCNIKYINIDGGTHNYTEFFNVTFVNDANVLMCKLFKCTIEAISLKSLPVVLICCTTTSSNSLGASVNIIGGFIWGCDFSSLTSVPGVIMGANCCKFKSTLLSQGVILADMFGNKNAKTNGMNTGV